MNVPGIPALGAALSAARIDAQFSMLAAVRQVETIQELGQNTLQLIDAARLDPSVGQHIDLRI